MSELTDILNQLPELGFKLNSPASQKELAALQASFGELDNSILELYRHHNGMPVDGIPPIKEVEWPLSLFDMRFMPVKEVIEFNQTMDSFSRDLTFLAPILKNARFLWTDDNANAMGIYFSGELKGKIFILDHEVAELAPYFSSLVSMYQQWLLCSRFNLHNKDAIDDAEIEPCYALDTWNTEYPRTKPSEDDEEELKISLSYIEKAKAEDDRRIRCEYLLITLNLIPFGETQRLVPFLDDDNMFIRSRAMKILSERKYGGMEEPFAKLISRDHHEAIWALGRVATSEAEQKLLEFMTIVQPNWKSLIAASLHNHFGYELKKIDENRYAYRKSANEEWTEYSD